MTRALDNDDIVRRIERVKAAGGGSEANFVRLIEYAGLDPAKDLRFGNWTGVNFAGCDLAGYDFSGSVLVGCQFGGARINGAIFTQCEFGRAYNFRRHGWSLLFDSTPLGNIEAAADWEDAQETALGLEEKFPGRSDHLLVGARFRDGLFGPLMTVIPSLPTYEGLGLKDIVFAVSDDITPLQNRVDAYRDGKPYVNWLSAKFKFRHDWVYHQPGVADWAVLIGVTEDEVFDRLDIPMPGNLFSDYNDYSHIGPVYEATKREMGERLCRLIRVPSSFQ